MLITWTSSPVEGTSILNTAQDASVSVLVDAGGGCLFIEGAQRKAEIFMERPVAIAASVILGAYLTRAPWARADSDPERSACMEVICEGRDYQEHSPLLRDTKGQPIALDVDLLIHYAGQVVETVAAAAAAKVRAAKIKRLLTEAYNLAYDRNFRIAGSIVVVPEGYSLNPLPIANELLAEAFPDEVSIQVEKALDESKDLKRLRDLYRNWETFVHARFMISRTGNIIHDEEDE